MLPQSIVDVGDEWFHTPLFAPGPGKLRLRGENALAEASAAGNEVDNVRLQLIESAKDAFYEYYLVYRAIEVNEENLRLLRDFRSNAETRYRTGLVAEQDVLQADVEIGRQQERQETLKRMREVAIARIDTLLNFAPDDPLPPPPKEINVGDALPEAQELRNAALGLRPDLQALANRIRAEDLPGGESLARQVEDSLAVLQPNLFAMGHRFISFRAASSCRNGGRGEREPSRHRLHDLLGDAACGTDPADTSRA